MLEYKFIPPPPSRDSLNYLHHLPQPWSGTEYSKYIPATIELTKVFKTPARTIIQSGECRNIVVVIITVVVAQTLSTMRLQHVQITTTFKGRAVNIDHC